jgi:hypothetical protein
MKHAGCSRPRRRQAVQSLARLVRPNQNSCRSVALGSLISISGKILRCLLDQVQEVSNDGGRVASARREVQNELRLPGASEPTVGYTVHGHSLHRSRYNGNAESDGDEAQG